MSASAGEPARSHRRPAVCTRALPRPAPHSALVKIIEQSAGTIAVVDEQYTVTAVMIERDCCGQTETLLVELLEDHLRADGHRWTAIAYDDLDQLHTEPSHGPTAAAAVDGIDWCHLTSTR